MNSNREALRLLVAGSFGVSQFLLSESMSFREDLGADSMDMFELSLSIERRFNVVLPDDKLDAIDSVRDIFELFPEIFGHGDPPRAVNLRLRVIGSTRDEALRIDIKKNLDGALEKALRANGCEPRSRTTVEFSEE